jgi:hypothetical protein
MDDGELVLITQLSFIRSDLEQFVFSVLGSIDQQFGAVAWPANEVELGHQLVTLGRALEWHAALGAVSSRVDKSRLDS